MSTKLLDIPLKHQLLLILLVPILLHTGAELAKRLFPKKNNTSVKSTSNRHSNLETPSNTRQAHSLISLISLLSFFKRALSPISDTIFILCFSGVASILFISSLWMIVLLSFLAIFLPVHQRNQMEFLLFSLHWKLLLLMDATGTLKAFLSRSLTVRESLSSVLRTSSPYGVLSRWIDFLSHFCNQKLPLRSPICTPFTPSATAPSPRCSSPRTIFSVPSRCRLSLETDPSVPSRCCPSWETEPTMSRLPSPVAEAPILTLVKFLVLCFLVPFLLGLRFLTNPFFLLRVLRQIIAHCISLSSPLSLFSPIFTWQRSRGVALYHVKSRKRTSKKFCRFQSPLLTALDKACLPLFLRDVVRRIAKSGTSLTLSIKARDFTFSSLPSSPTKINSSSLTLAIARAASLLSFPSPFTPPTTSHTSSPTPLQTFPQVTPWQEEPMTNVFSSTETLGNIYRSHPGLLLLKQTFSFDITVPQSPLISRVEVEVAHYLCVSSRTLSIKTTGHAMDRENNIVAVSGSHSFFNYLRGFQGKLLVSDMGHLKELLPELWGIKHKQKEIDRVDAREYCEIRHNKTVRLKEENAMMWEARVDQMMRDSGVDPYTLRLREEIKQMKRLLAGYASMIKRLKQRVSDCQIENDRDNEEREKERKKALLSAEQEATKLRHEVERCRIREKDLKEELCFAGEEAWKTRKEVRMCKALAKDLEKELCIVRAELERANAREESRIRAAQRKQKFLEIARRKEERKEKEAAVIEGRPQMRRKVPQRGMTV